MIIFVYGTLMKGFSGHNEYLTGKEPEAKGYIKGELFHLPEGYPIAIENSVSEVHGEIYCVSEESLSRIREYEDIDEADPLYIEKAVKVYTDREVVQATVFLASKRYEKQIREKGMPILSGRWRDFIL
jgi:gamma-glutamylcyclotransferase (GGCT)/AIG2-like uncharacterized protein YtfP